ncbi:unnamed protein product [Pylaiella littoralis]
MHPVERRMWFVGYATVILGRASTGGAGCTGFELNPGMSSFCPRVTCACVCVCLFATDVFHSCLQIPSEALVAGVQRCFETTVIFGVNSYRSGKPKIGKKTSLYRNIVHFWITT